MSTEVSEVQVIESTYFQKRMDLYGITPELNSIEVLKFNAEKGENEKVPVPIFRETDRGIDIIVYTLDRVIPMHAKEGSRWKGQEFKITRLSNPDADAKGNGRKYDIPKGVGTHPFIPPSLLKKFEEKTPLDNLILTEGYFKAFKASMHGFDCIGLSSITHYRDKSTSALHQDIVRIIKACQVKRVIWLVDGDCLDLSSKVFDEKDPADLNKRPGQFFSSAQAIKELLDDYDIEKIFCHINSDAHPQKPKGLDDLLIEMKGQEEVVLNDFLTFSRPSHYFHKINMTYSTNKVHSYFHLKNVDDFYSAYLDRYPLLAKREFGWYGTKYRYDENKNECKIVVPGDAKLYFRVGDHYHEKLVIPNKYGNLDKTFHRRMKQTIIDDYDKKFLEHIPKYKAFCVVPDHQNYQDVLNNCFNLYAPFEHEAGEGDCDITLEFLEHIFGSGEVSFKNPETKKTEKIKELDLGLDYIQLLYQQPTHILPILCLVSKENGTGKSTLGKWLRMLFTQNVAIVGNAELADNFNASWASKLLIICDEAKIDKQVVVEKVKSLSTADTIFMNSKGKDHVEIQFFGKFIFLTNNEDNFIYASDEDVRYWIRKVPVAKKLNVHILKDLKEEIPAFLTFLNKRKLVTQDLHRGWFHPDLIKTEALQKVIQYSQGTLEKELRTHIRDRFLDFPDLNVIEMSKSDIKNEFFKNKNYEFNYFQRVLEDKLNVRMFPEYFYQDRYFKTPEELLQAFPEAQPETCVGYGIRTKRYKYHRWETRTNTDGLIEQVRVEVNQSGRPYVFKVEDFLLPGEIKSRGYADSELRMVFGDGKHPKTTSDPEELPF